MTSARSDIIANRQVDVWEIAWVWAYPVAERSQIDELEARLFLAFDGKSKLFNGSRPRGTQSNAPVPEPAEIVQVLPSGDIASRRDPAQRLPRQAAHYASIVSHFVAVKNSEEIARAMQAHFERLQRYQRLLLEAAEPG